MRTMLIALLAILLPLSFARAADRPPIYPEDGKGLERVQEALKTAKAENKHVLLMTGGNWCGWCHLLHGVFETNEDIHTLLGSEYVVVMIDTAADKNVMEKWAIEPQGVPYLTVLDAEGKKLTDQETASLEDGPKHDPAKVMAFLKQWTAPQRDARDVLKEAEALALKEDKRVFLRFGAEGCGWCRRWDEFLVEPEMKAIFEKAFVLAKVDAGRSPGSGELRQELSCGQGGGVPWFAFLDASGKVLATANGPQGNIGFPVRPETELPHFEKMVWDARSSLRAEDVAAVMARLEKTSAEVRSR